MKSLFKKLAHFLLIEDDMIRETVIDPAKLKKTLEFFPKVGPITKVMLDDIRPLLKEFRELVKGHTFKVKIKKNIPVELETEVVFCWNGHVKSPTNLKSTKVTSINKLSGEQNILVSVLAGRLSEAGTLDIVEKANKEMDQIVNAFMDKIAVAECKGQYPLNFLYKVLLDQVSK